MDISIHYQPRTQSKMLISEQPAEEPVQEEDEGQAEVEEPEIVPETFAKLGDEENAEALKNLNYDKCKF